MNKHEFKDAMHEYESQKADTALLISQFFFIPMIIFWIGTETKTMVPFLISLAASIIMWLAQRFINLGVIKSIVGLVFTLFWGTSGGAIGYGVNLEYEVYGAEYGLLVVGLLLGYWVNATWLTAIFRRR